MFNVIEHRADYCGITSGYLGESSRVAATFRTMAEAFDHAEHVRAMNGPSYDPADYHVTVEGVKADLNVRCIGGGDDNIPRDVKNGCSWQPYYYACAVSDADWNGDRDAW